MPDLQKIKLDFRNLYGKSKQNPEMPEEELRTLFNKSAILENPGYGAIGKEQEAQGIAALEGEINELVYKLYGLDETDKKVLEEFLGKF